MDDYMMSIAVGVRARANCLGSQIGAVLARDGHIVSTGYNGTPHKTPNCDENGCVRCSNRDLYPAGTGYDMCICVHAEQNALLSAARFGIAVEAMEIVGNSRASTQNQVQSEVKVYLSDKTYD